jgi:hypothetical protein
LAGKGIALGDVSETLADIDLVEDKRRARALKENRYFCSEWPYARQYLSVVGVRPLLQIELTASAPVLGTVICQIGSLADKFAGRQDNNFAVINAPPFGVTASSLPHRQLRKPSR